MIDRSYEGKKKGSFWTLRFAAYQPLDAKATCYAMGLAQRPAPDGTVCLRPDNWEYALDCSAGMGSAMQPSSSLVMWCSRWVCTR